MDETTIDGEMNTADSSQTELVPKSHFEDQRGRAEKAEADAKEKAAKVAQLEAELKAKNSNSNSSNSTVSHDDLELIADQYGVDPNLIAALSAGIEKNVAKKYGIEDIQKDRVKTTAEKAFDAVVGAKEVYKDIADKEAVIAYSLATGQSIEDSLSFLYGNTVKKVNELAPSFESTRVGGNRINSPRTSAEMTQNEIEKLFN